MFASVSAVIFNIVLGSIFISLFGYLAAGYSMLICYLLQATLDYFALKKVVKEKVYNMRYIGILSAIVILIVLLSNLVYEIPYIRYGIFVVLMGLCLVFKDKITATLKELRSR